MVDITPEKGTISFTALTPKVRARPRSWIATLNGRNIREVFIILITFTHPDLTDDIRISSDRKDTLTTGVKGVVSNELEYVYIPFRIILPNLERGVIPMARVSVDNISREIVDTLSRITSPPNVRIQITLSTNPDIVEYDLDGLRLVGVTFNELTIDGNFSPEFYFTEPYPAPRFTPSRFPALFKGRNVAQSV